jgi:peptidoglycan/xylan/chitin deacetylase (PgdA/CDA1 family)
MIRRLLGRRAAEDASSGTPAEPVEATQLPAEPAADGMAENAAEGSLNAVAATARAARRELDLAIDAAVEIRATLDRLSRFNGETDVEFVAYLDGRLADVRARVTRLAGGLSDEERALGTVSSTLLELNERRVDVDEARLASVRALTAPFRTPEPGAHTRDAGDPDAARRPDRLRWRRSWLRRPAIQLVHGLRTVAVAMALLLAATLVDASSATTAGQLPTDGAEFASLPGDDSLATPPVEPAAVVPAAAVNPTSDPPTVPSLEPAPRETAVTGTAAPSPAAAEPSAAPEAPAPVLAVPTTARVTYHAQTDRPVVALTFDDGWSGKNGRLILDILVREKVPATFFLNGTYLAGNLQLWRDVADAGFTVGNHTWRHSDVTRMSTQDIVVDLQRNAAAFEAATGHQMAPIFRPPYGLRNATSDAAAALAGYPDVVLWDTTDNDTRRYSDAQVIATGTAGKPGSIVLLHVGPDVTPRILEDLLHSYWSRGIGFVPLLDLLYPDGYPVVAAPAAAATPAPAEPTPPETSPAPAGTTPLLGAR